METNCWRGLELVRGPTAVVATWQQHLGDICPAFSRAFLKRCVEPVRNYLCPIGCGCVHEVTGHVDDSLVAVCRCESRACEDLDPSRADAAFYELSRTRLGRALCRAFGLGAHRAELGLPNTRQVGTWSADAVPVILTVHSERWLFRQATAEWAAPRKQPFILLAPTASAVAAIGKELLSNVGAGFLASKDCVRLNPDATLQSLKAPRELFARLQPQAKDELEPDMARRAFGLLEQLEAESPSRPPAVLTVFRL
jgi:hypothetical protein